MNPTISTFAIVQIEGTKNKDLAVGDIVLYRRNFWDDNILHRIIWIDPVVKNYFLIKGDNDKRTDMVPRKNIYGRFVKAWKVF